MHGRRDSITYVSNCLPPKQGLTPTQINPKESSDAFWREYLSLDVDRTYITEQLNTISKEDFLGHLKPLLGALFLTCLKHMREAPYDDVRKAHAVEIMTVLTRSLLRKSDLAGWEVMEMFAGEVNKSDKFFMDFSATVDDLLGDEKAPAGLRHDVLQLVIIFMCGINQLSPGAYFLRRDMFPAIVSFTKGPETGRFAFEALLLLGLLANFHKSDAAKLNPYLQRISETTDVDYLQKICWAANFASAAAVKAYQDISDDSPPTMASTLGSFLTSLRPDRALASTQVDPPRELFKNQPIEACIVLLPVFEFLTRNPTFVAVLSQGISNDTDKTPANMTPLALTLISLSSYLLTHATSSSSARAISYATLSMNILLAAVEKQEFLRALCESTPYDIRLCRQRLPTLPLVPPPRPPMCALLDTSVLWLRHNLHKRLEVHLYLTCIRLLHRVIWSLQNEHIRLEYGWLQLWKAVIGVLDFLANKLENLDTTGGVEMLLQETIVLLDLVCTKADAFLPSPHAVHELIYELVRSAPTLRKQPLILQSVALQRTTGNPSSVESQASQALSRLLTTNDYYEDKLGSAQARSANKAISIVARDIEQDGIHGVRDTAIETPPLHSEGVIIFLRHVYTDGMALMP
ncbi:hypothetical protein FA95DRAFT_1675192 [Auriscalpium vulgare]|uniref:Uncharacterized protein n=1 Tax=Auriscalpium vulgare TaxID=40419 RepID=A0ACB8S9F6_9AGAM|nr:hypothetical protein FA95DRAFT_1675192 [Auriscalpium vulgare]